MLIMVIACILFCALCRQVRFKNLGGGGQKEKEKGGKKGENEVKSVVWERKKGEMMV